MNVRSADLGSIGVSSTGIAIHRMRWLAGLNAGLVVVLAGVHWSGLGVGGWRSVHGALGGSVAQAAQPGTLRSRGNYTMVAGRAQGGSTHTIYVFDSANQELLALTWDRNKNDLTPIGLRSIAGDGQYNLQPR